MLDFIHRNFPGLNETRDALKYCSSVCPICEYESIISVPYQSGLKYKLEKNLSFKFPMTGNRAFLVCTLNFIYSEPKNTVKISR